MSHIWILNKNKSIHFHNHLSFITVFSDSSGANHQGATSHLRTTFSETSPPPSGSIQTEPRDPDCRTADDRTSSRTWPLLSPTNPLLDHNRCLPKPGRKIPAISHKLYIDHYSAVQFNSIQFNTIQYRHLHAPTYKLSRWHARRTKITRWVRAQVRISRKKVSLQ